METLNGVEVLTEEKFKEIYEYDSTESLGKPSVSHEQIIFDEIIKHIEEKELLPWRKTWVENSEFPPTNFATKHVYTGINAFWLNFHSRPNNYYLTYKQIKNLGGTLIKGSKAVWLLMYVKLFFDTKEEKYIGEQEAKELLEKSKNRVEERIRKTYYKVFNATDIQGIDWKLNDVKVLSNVERIESCQVMLDSFSKMCPLIHSEQSAYYSPKSDKVNLPVIESFESEMFYYSVGFHEFIHATGHESRLDRFEKGVDFGSIAYSKEELVAEIGAAFLCGEGGILFHTTNNSKSYINSWLKVLKKKSKEDRNFLIEAFAKAQKAKAFLMEKGWRKNKNANLGAAYIPGIEDGYELEVETPDSMAYEVHEAIKKLKGQIGDFTNYLSKKLKYSRAEVLKYFASEQIDGIALSIYNIENRNQGLIIGDQTGIGKGRQVAAMIRYAKVHNLKSVFFTEKPFLFSDIYRDLENIDSKSIVPFIVNSRDSRSDIYDKLGKLLYRAPKKTEHNQVFKSNALPSEYDFLMLTYSQVNSSKASLKKSFIKEYSKDAVIILDESHNASGDSNLSQFIKSLLSESLGVLYSSATFAKRPDNLPVYSLKTSLSDVCLTQDELEKAFSNGGMALQEFVSSQLVQEGQMIRRERHFKGTEINYITLKDNKPEHEKIANIVTGVLNKIIRFEKEYINNHLAEYEKKQEKRNQEGISQVYLSGLDKIPFDSKVFNIMNQLVFSLKALEVSKQTIIRLNQGKAPVIAFSNTIGSVLEDLSIGEEIQNDFSIILLKALDSALEYKAIFQGGVIEKRKILLEELDKLALEEYSSIRNKIIKAEFELPASPIDLICEELSKEGYSTSEVTGRTRKLVKQTSGVWEVKSISKVKPVDSFRNFNNNEIDVLLINRSGATGASAHAIETDKVSRRNVKQRVMISLQSEFNINTEVQKRGRISRTGSLFPPIYDYILTSLPFEKRLQAMLQKKLESLDANTTSNSDSNSRLNNVIDFLNSYGDEVVSAFVKTNSKILNLISKTAQEKLKEPGEYSKYVTGKIALLPVKEQELFYSEIEEEYKEYIKELKRTGEYNLDVDFVDFKADLNSSRVLMMGDSQSSSFGSPAYFEEYIVDNPELKITIKQVSNLLQKYSNQSLESSDIRLFTEEFYRKKKQEVNSQMLRFQEDEIEAFYKTKECKDLQEAKQFDEFTRKIESIKTKSRRKFGKASSYLDSTLKNIKSTLSNLYSGDKVNFIEYEQGEAREVSGVILGYSIKRDIEGEEKFKANNIVLNYVSTSGGSVKSIPLTLNNKSVLNSFSKIHADIELESFWESEQKRHYKKRKSRYIITGNLIIGFSKYKGKLITFTTEQGYEKKGILLPPTFKKKQENYKIYELPITYLFNHLLKSNSYQFSSDEFDIRLNVIRSEKVFSVNVKHGSSLVEILDDESLLSMPFFYSKGEGYVSFIVSESQNLKRLLGLLKVKYGLRGGMDWIDFKKFIPPLKDDSITLKERQEFIKKLNKTRHIKTSKKGLQQFSKNYKELKKLFNQ